MSGTEVEKVVVVVDLSRYSDICNLLEQQLGTSAVGALNDQIKELIDFGLINAGIKSGSQPYKSTGDGAIIALDTASAASLFAEKLHKAAEQRNLGKTVELAQRHFRVGIWSGKLFVRPESHGKGYPTTFDIAGTSIANAVRLEGACRTGEVLIGSEAWAQLKPDDRKLYSLEEIVKGKRAEEFRAHRRKVIAPAPWDTTRTGTGKTPVTPTSNGVLEIHKRRLEILQKQAAMFGPLTPPYITMDIEETKRVISELEA
jgi:hypothetical protein